jgi:hypothetical protein
MEPKSFKKMTGGMNLEELKKLKKHIENSIKMI